MRWIEWSEQALPKNVFAHLYIKLELSVDVSAEVKLTPLRAIKAVFATPANAANRPYGGAGILILDHPKIALAPLVGLW